MDEEKSRVDALNEKLYSRTRYADPLDKRSSVKELESPDLGEKWESQELDEMLKYERVVQPLNPFMKKVFVFALLFFVAAVGIAAFVFMGGANFVSSRNVDISVVGPTTVSAGEVLGLGVSISNANNADLETATLTIQYPQGSHDPDDTAKPLTFVRSDLGAIRAGAESIYNARAVILGTTGEVKEIKFSLEYKVSGSNATFYKEKIYEITIGQAPLALTVESPRSVVSGNVFTTVVSVTLNAADPLRNVALKIEYPYGYTVVDATPAAAVDNNIWMLGDLAPGTRKTITIRGRLIGENREERTSRFYVGVAGSGQNPNLTTTIVSALNTIGIERPSVSLGVLFNGENVSPYLAPAGRTISTSIRFQNNLQARLLNPRIELRLSGSALDQSSVRPSGNVAVSDNSSSIIWETISVSGASELGPGESGQLTLNFASLPLSSLPEGTHDITLNLTLSGTPVGAVGQAPVTVSETRTVRISSQVSFSSRILRTLGNFANHGPIPPKVGEETTYTVVFNVGNTQNDLSSAQVTATLGPAVKWIGAHSTESEDIRYNEETQTVTWNLGRVPSGAGFSSPAREISFQVGLTPLVGQVGTVPTLVSGITLSGRDDSTGATVTVNNPPLTTRLSSDPTFIQGDDIVVR